MKPTVSRNRFSAKSKDELTIGVAAEWQTDIEEKHMAQALTVTVVEHLPHSARQRVCHGVACVLCCNVPEIGIALRFHHGGSANNAAFHLGDVDFGVLVVQQLNE